jgi:hypothetical protein
MFAYMAKIRSARRGTVLRVVVSGRLRTVDMGRLEHACAPALTSHPVELELDLRRVTHVDATAMAFLERLSQRGARIPHLIDVIRAYPRPAPQIGQSNRD